MQCSKSNTEVTTATFHAQRNTIIISTFITLHLKKPSNPSSLKISIPALGSQFTSPENTSHWFSLLYSDPSQHILLKPARHSPSAQGIFLLKIPWLLAYRIETKIFDLQGLAWLGAQLAPQLHVTPGSLILVVLASFSCKNLPLIAHTCLALSSVFLSVRSFLLTSEAILDPYNATSPLSLSALHSTTVLFLYSFSYAYNYVFILIFTCLIACFPV